ncbi:MAG TPA: NADH-quinone oxidoreductase subunit J [Pirellulales bacterium]|nr:NADH-quinone oxidoreductase subunit J [Pirellulales bacterium]
MSWQTFLFLLYSAVACGFALLVVLSSNVVRMAFYLVVSLGATAGRFFLAGADFVGAMQLMIYVGGTLVLLVFGVMLTAQGPFVSMKTRGGDWILAALLAGSLLAFLAPAAFSVRDWTNAPEHAGEEHHASAAPQKSGARFQLTASIKDEATDDSKDEAADTAGMEDAETPESKDAEVEQVAAATPVQKDTATRLGMGLLGARVDQLEDRPEELKRGMSGYLLPFEIVSVHLLVVLVGAAYLARTKRRATS